MKLKYSFEFQEVCGSYMAVAVGEGADKYQSFIRLNETGKRILELLPVSGSVDDVVAALRNEYESTDDVLRKAVLSIMEQLKEQGLLL